MIRLREELQETRARLTGRRDRTKVITTEAPPQPGAIEETTRFVGYPDAVYREATDWARAELGRKQPGAIGTLEQLQSLTDQYLAARRPRPAESA